MTSLISAQRRHITITINQITDNQRNMQLVQNSAQVAKQRKGLENPIIGNELSVLIGLVDLAYRFGSSYTISLSKISWKCGLRTPEVIKHIQSLHKKGVIVVKKQSHNHDQKQQNEFYSLELADISAIHEPLSVRFYPSIRKGDQ